MLPCLLLTAGDQFDRPIKYFSYSYNKCDQYKEKAVLKSDDK